MPEHCHSAHRNLGQVVPPGNVGWVVVVGVEPVIPEILGPALTLVVTLQVDGGHWHASSGDA
eukprot:4686702-Lingulodinium_polyedra.AAC.1